MNRSVFATIAVAGVVLLAGCPMLDDPSANTPTTTSYTVTVNPIGAESGESVSANVSEAAEGTTVTLTASLNSERQVALSASGVSISPAVISSNGGTATFAMAAQAVEVSAEFGEAGSDEPVNSYRDPRWVTGSDAHWTSEEGFDFDLRVWEDGTSTLNGTAGQWFTSNNIAFVFVPSSGSNKTYPYILLNETQGWLISDQRFTAGGCVGMIEKESTGSSAKPNIPGLESGADLAAAAGDSYDMIDMVNIPESDREQDSRLLDGTNHGWFSDSPMIGSPYYRADIDPDELRFTVNADENQTMLANGDWFTVNNTFLRVTHSSGYTTDYLYALDSDGTLYHLSVQAYDLGSFVIFEHMQNDEIESVCGTCGSEIPKDEPASPYATLEDGYSTFVPAPCPAGGCE